MPAGRETLKLEHFSHSPSNSDGDLAPPIICKMGGVAVLAPVNSEMIYEMGAASDHGNLKTSGKERSGAMPAVSVFIKWRGGGNVTLY